MIGNHARPRIRESPFWQGYDQRRNGILFFVLPITMILMPIVTTFGLPATLIKLLLGTCLFAAVMPNATRRSRRILFMAIILLVAGRAASEYHYLPVNPALMLSLVGLAGLAAAGAALRFTLRAKAVNQEIVYAALSTYLLAGVFFGQIYWSIEGIRPGSIVGPDPLSEQSAV